ncbi:MAG: hypothetical protein ACK52H_12715 [Burkholderiales bacterium]|jgi:hypothetical protein
MNTQIRVQPQSQTPQVALPDLVMAWARDEETGEPRYIMELGAERRGSRSGCVCPSCLAPLTAVNAAKAEFIRRPHFRHPPGTEKQSCSIVAARFALLKEVQVDGWLQLPQRRRKVTAIGLSGHTYETWVSAIPQKVRVADVDFQDHTRAVLTLDNGRRIQVLLTGSATLSSTDEILACLTLNVDDPQASSFSPEELRKRLTLMPEWLCWQSHWEDRALEAQARGLLEWQMVDSMDAAPPDLDLSAVPAELHRETVLHFLAKQILADAGEIRTPAIHHEVSKQTGLGIDITRSWYKPETTYTLTNVKLECRLGQVVPDIVCEACDEDGNVFPRLSIEITVTNPIDGERKARLRQEGAPTLELDLSRTGGRLTKAGFRDMLVQEVSFKNWIWHPQGWAALEELQRQVDEEVQRTLAKADIARKLRAEAIAMDVSEIGQQYLAAMTGYLELQDLLDASEPGATRETVEAARVETMRQADMLGFHGYFGKAGLTKGQAVRVLSRLLSLKHDRGIGFKYATGFEVLNSIWQFKDSNRQDIPMYMGAARHWKIRLNKKQAETVQSWRTTMVASLTAAETTYLRSNANDRLLTLLFPDLAEVLATTTSIALQSRFAPTGARPVNRDGFYTGAKLERWLQDHPDLASAWVHLRG